MAMRLYDLSSNYIQLVDMLENAENIEAVKDTLDAVEEAFEQKVENIAKLIRSKETELLAVNDELKRLSDRKKRLDKEVEWLSSYVHHELERTGMYEVKSSLFNIRLRNNPPSVNVINETELPMDYIKVEEVRKVDKRAILEQLKNGVSIPGVELVRKRSLSIK